MTAKDRHAFVSLADGGLLLDLESGRLLQLNATATFVWRQFLDGVNVDAIASAIADRHGIEVARARADVESALASQGPPEPAPPEHYQFRRTSTGYLHLYRGEPELEIDATGAELRVVLPTSERRPRRLRNSIQALVPKILSLRGHTVTHASAVLTRGRLLVFSGRSGTGKTTTARAFAQEGATLVCEDKLLVRADAEGCVTWRGAEGHVHAWVLRAAASILADGRVSCEELDAAASPGESLPIGEIGFFDDVTPRHGEDLVTRRLGIADAAAAWFRGMFLGTDGTDAWRRQLQVAATLAEQVPGYAVTMPDGLELLARAAERVDRRGTLEV